MRAAAPFGYLLLAAGAGASLGCMAWGEGRAPALAILLPLAVAACRTRAQAYALAAGYAAGVLRYAAAFIGSWFDDRLFVGIAAVAAYMVVTGAAWCLGWSNSPTAWRRAGAMSCAWLVALVPAGIAAPGHPLIATGYLLPGTGWYGVGWSLAFAVACAAIASPAIAMVRSSRWQEQTAALGLMAVALASLITFSVQIGAEPERHGPTRKAVAVTTFWGATGGMDLALARMQAMGATAIPPAAGAVIWPESVLGRWDPSFYRVLDLEVLRPAKRQGRTVVIGMDVPLPEERLLNAAVAFHPDGTTQTAVARQPAPGSLWKPWRSSDTFLANWAASNILVFGDERAALIFCYEEYVPFLYLLNELRDQPTLYVALTNTWAARQPAAAAIQTWHSYGLARLFGRPYIKAENRPAPAGADHSRAAAVPGPATVAAASRPGQNPPRLP